jgi:hypothetical protein
MLFNKKYLKQSGLDVIQMARSKLSESCRSETVKGNNHWLDVRETSSNFSEGISPAAIHSAGSDASRWNGIWKPGFRVQLASSPPQWCRRVVLPRSLPAGSLAGLSADCWAGMASDYLAAVDSIMVERVRHVLRRWRGVCSFSRTMRRTGAMKKVVWWTTFAPKTMSTWRMICSNHT